MRPFSDLNRSSFSAPSLATLQGGALVLLALIVSLFGAVLAEKKSPIPKPPESEQNTPSKPLLFDGKPLKAVFETELALTPQTPQGEANPFFTEYYRPKPKPKPQPKPEPEPTPPPAPKTKTVHVTYQGFFKTESGPRQAYVRVDEDLQKVSADSPLLDDWVVEAIEPTYLLIKNRKTEAPSQKLPFNQSESFDIPIPSP